jgi:hypothetical protein
LFGGDLARLNVLVGSAAAYVIVQRRRVYPFGRIGTSGAKEEAKEDAISTELERHKGSAANSALAWFALLLLISGLSMLISDGQGYYFIFERVTKISTLAVLLTSYLGKNQALSVHNLASALRAIDYAILSCVSLFLSMTGSACLYWLFIHYRTVRKKAV